MRTSNTTVSFRKTAACPPSSELLSYRSRALSAIEEMFIREHLGGCDFCSAELGLLAHDHATPVINLRVPEMPINLRILAESILSHRKPKKVALSQE